MKFCAGQAEEEIVLELLEVDLIGLHVGEQLVALGLQFVLLDLDDTCE